MMEGVCDVFHPASIEAGPAMVTTTQVKEEEDRIGPFVAYEDGYVWPTLYCEIDEMLENNIMIYPLAELRRKARQREIDKRGVDEVLKLPLTHASVMEIIDKNRGQLLDTKFVKDEEFYQEIFQTVEERQMTLCLAAKQNGEKPNVSHAEIIAFDDEFEKAELVYSIVLNHTRKRVTVCFRGSVTKMDWAADFEIFMKEVPNPMKAHASQAPSILVHRGFFKYLFQPSSRGVKGPNGEDLSEYQEIMQEHVVPVLHQYPGYKLYVTGHSLGAALATLFAFQAAAEPDFMIPKPVSLFSVAGPYVGDISFRSAHQLLESLGKLRHLRITNHKDLVTTVPKMSFCWKWWDPISHVGALFKHAGVNLRLLEGSAPFEVAFPMVRTGYFSSTVDELVRGWDQSLFTNFSWNPTDLWKWPYHSLREYSKRTEEHKASLSMLYLNDLYSQADIVGQLVPQF